MKVALSSVLLSLLLGLVAVGCKDSVVETNTGQSGPDRDLVGQWRAKVQFTSGGFAAIHDLEFMYVFNLGGTMTESSNYDVAPPVPPAYGIWRKTGKNQFEARYEFYLTKTPSDLSAITQGGGWLPLGRGVLTEKITISETGDTFASKLRYEPLDSLGVKLEGGGVAEGQGARLKF
jgi:hypothetical protein